MNAPLIAGLAALAGAVPLVSLGLSAVRRERRSRVDAMRYLGRDGTRVEGDASALHAVATALVRLSPPRRVERLRARLTRAGGRDSVESFVARRLLAGSGAAAAALVLGLGLLSAALIGGAGFVLPDVALSRRIRLREEEIARALPDSIDLMAITLEAGVGLEGAMARAADDVGGPLGEEYRRVLHETQLGASRREALRGLRERVEVAEMSSFVLALLQADAIGMSIAKALKVQSQEMRKKRRQRAREEAAKTPVKILFPLVFGIFPAMLVVTMGPAMIRILSALAGR